MKYLMRRTGKEKGFMVSRQFWRFEGMVIASVWLWWSLMTDGIEMVGGVSSNTDRRWIPRWSQAPCKFPLWQWLCSTYPALSLQRTRSPRPNGCPCLSWTFGTGLGMLKPYLGHSIHVQILQNGNENPWKWDGLPKAAFWEQGSALMWGHLSEN